MAKEVTLTIPTNPTRRDFFQHVEKVFPLGTRPYRKIEQAHILMEVVFKQKRRDTGKKFITHLRLVAMRTMVASVKIYGFVRYQDVVRALLHDLFEDFRGERWPIKIAVMFGLFTTISVWFLTKPPRAHFGGSRKRRQRCFYRKLYLASQRVILIKISDRIDNLEDMWLDYHDVAYQKSKIQETEQVYLLLARKHRILEQELLDAIKLARSKLEQF